MVTVVLPARDIQVVDKVDNSAAGEANQKGLLITTKGKVSDICFKGFIINFVDQHPFYCHLYKYRFIFYRWTCIEC